MAQSTAPACMRIQSIKSIAPSPFSLCHRKSDQCIIRLGLPPLKHSHDAAPVRMLQCSVHEALGHVTEKQAPGALRYRYLWECYSTPTRTLSVGLPPAFDRTEMFCTGGRVLI